MVHKKTERRKKSVLLFHTNKQDIFRLFCKVFETGSTNAPSLIRAPQGWCGLLYLESVVALYYCLIITAITMLVIV